MTKKRVNQNVVEICLTCKCNLDCPNCAHFCSNFRSEEYMPLEKIHYFVNESIRLNKIWHKISLTGGEPTLHPYFLEVLDIILGYKKHFKKFLSHFAKNVLIELDTNGVGEEVNKVISMVSDNVYIRIRNDFERHNYSIINKQTNHYDVCVAPIDLEEYKKDIFMKECYYSSTCGMAYTNWGFYPCSISAHIDRVMGFDKGIKTIKEIKKMNMDIMLKHFCKYCGLYKYDIYGYKYDKKRNLGKCVMSPIWERKYREYNG